MFVFQYLKFFGLGVLPSKSSIVICNSFMYYFLINPLSWYIKIERNFKLTRDFLGHDIEIKKMFFWKFYISIGHF